MASSSSNEPPACDDVVRASSSSNEPPASDDVVRGSSSSSEPLASDDVVRGLSSSNEPPASDDVVRGSSSSNEPPASDDVVLASSNELPASDDVVIASSLNTITMSQDVEVMEVSPSPPGHGIDRQDSAAAAGAPEDEATPSSRGESTETIARGIASVLGPVVRMFETRVDEVLKSQSTLESSIDRLTRELDKLLEDTPLPLGAQHAAKLSGIRKRVGSLTETLRIIQGRINSMDHMLSKESVGSLH